MCVCKGYNRHNYLCLRGPVWGGCVGVQICSAERWSSTMAKAQALCVCVYGAEGWQVSAIIDYLHTATRACSRALNTEMYTPDRRSRHSPMPFFPSLSPSHTCAACLQCISVSVSIRVRGRDWRAPASTSLWQKPGHCLTLEARLCQNTATERETRMV